MVFDWTTLARVDTIFGILSGIVLIVSGTRWITARIKISRFSKTISWILTGKDDEGLLKITFQNSMKWFFAVIVWAIIGSLVGIFIVLLLTGIAVGLGSSVSGVADGIKDFSIIGALVGAFVRIIAFPIYSVIKNWMRRNINKSFSLSNALILYPHKNRPYNAVKLLYVGDEIAKDLQVRVLHTDKEGNKKVKHITEFFPEDDPRMWQYHFKHDYLKQNQVAYFHLLQKSSSLDGKALVSVDFIGAKSGVPVHLEKEFDLVL